MNWAVWLSIPAGATVLAAIGSWWRSRPRRPLDAADAMREHDQFLDALTRTARAKERGLRSD